MGLEPTQPQPVQPEQEAQERATRRSQVASEAVVAALADAVRDQEQGRAPAGDRIAR